MARYLSCSLIILGFCNLVVSRNESNILRLSKPQKVVPTVVKSNHVNNVSDYQREMKEMISTESHVGYSKNNPELDWKNHVKIAAENEEVPRDLDVNFMEDKIESTANSIQWLSDLYDPLKWKRVPGKLENECRKDMNSFLKSLKDGKLWAAKMSDASGRYSSQFHFGNGFWLGSSTLCKEINITKEKNLTGGTESVPPYKVSFHVARIYLTLPKELELSTRQVFLGLCLPSSCDRQSLTSMLRASADRVELEGNFTYRSVGPKIHIFTVKPVPLSDYTVWQDPKFYVLTTIGGGIVLLMMCAAIYEQNIVIESTDIESSSGTNNNEKVIHFADKNLTQDSCVSIVQENNEELIDKVSNNIQKKDLNTQIKDIKEREFWVKCLLAFSPTINGGKIISTEPAARDSLTCLHGLRVFSLGWVVMVHTYLQVFAIAENKTLRTITERNFMFQTISNATFSVDTFFFISGLLVTILFYRSLGSLKIDKSDFLKSSTSKFIVMVLYRFVRLTPAYLFVLGMNEISIKQVEARTVFTPEIANHLNCEQFWWRNAFYLNSLYPRKEMCMLWSWYMSNDTQFYVLGILLLLLSVKYKKIAISLVIFLIVSSCFTTFSVAYTNDYVARIQEPFALFDELYDKPWLRAGPYFIGTITGYLLFKTNCKIELSLYIKLTGWLLSGLIMFSVVYGLYPANLTVVVSSIYAALGHTAWALAVSFIVVQCCTGSARMIDSILSLRLMYPLSRLTYCAYLVHPVIMMITAGQMDGPLHLHNGIVLIVYFGNLVASYLVSFCISIALEAPVVSLLKIFFTGKKLMR
ncbi:nose resistant to fluoxetine protein 6-like [Polistes fuscatus]|uniref:nose resistant to fluoxetine protein 6-like n=1 Tax=Polistes fuscatus TaxID=30207 RepID=UPI001CA8C2F6|nr:nose resistant to fluoxetine protein 6-like [Polistes fuscatus]